MSQLTRQDVTEVVEEVLSRVLDDRFTTFEAKMDRKLDARFDEFEEKFDRKLDDRFAAFEGTVDQKLDEKLDQKLDEKLGAFVEHLDDKFDSLAEAVSLMNTTMKTLARQSDLETVKQDVTIIKRAVKENQRDFRNWEQGFGAVG